MIQKYCSDTSALFDLKFYWPVATFPTVWGRLDQLVKEGRLFAPYAVLEEIRRGDDELVQWADFHRNMFRPTDQPLLNKVREGPGAVPGLG